MKIVSKIPNLKSAYENDYDKYVYYQKINKEDGKIISQREEYYNFLLNCINKYYNEMWKIPKLSDSVYFVNTKDIEFINMIREFLEFYDIGFIDSCVERIDKFDNKYFDNKYINIEIKFTCSFEKFFNALYNEIQYMEYYETTKEEAQKKYQEFFERDEQRYRKYINNHQEEINYSLPNANNNSIPANQVYRVIKMLEDNNYGKYGIDKLNYIIADLYKLGFTTEKIMEFTELSEESVEKFKQLGR